MGFSWIRDTMSTVVRSPHATVSAPTQLFITTSHKRIMPSDLGTVVQKGLTKRKNYDAVELRPLASADDDDDVTEKKSKVDEWLEYAWRKLHALLWIVVASALAAYLQVFEVVVNGYVPGKPERQLHR